MTNINEKANQFMAEELVAAKLKDLDYKTACIQMSQTESGINSLKSILKNFSSWIEPFSKFIKEFNESIKKIYKNTPFSSYIDSIVYSQEQILNELDTLNKEIVKLYSKTSAWNVIFEQAKELKKEREEKKKKYEHYEQKLQKIENNSKKKKNDELLSRNEQKYRNSVQEYVQTCDNSLDVINNSLILSWNLVNPIISELIMIKKKSFNNIVFNLNDFSDSKPKIDEINIKKENKNINLPKKRHNRKSAIALSIHMKSINNNDNSNYGTNKTSNLLNFGRVTNSFGKIPVMRYKIFSEIVDEPY
jgi:hypothetical protein